MFMKTLPRVKRWIIVILSRKTGLAVLPNKSSTSALSMRRLLMVVPAGTYNDRYWAQSCLIIGTERMSALAASSSKAACQECRRVSGAGRRTKPGQVRPAVVVIAMEFSVLSCAARCARSQYIAAFAILRAPSLGSCDPRTKAFANIEG